MPKAIGMIRDVFTSLNLLPAPRLWHGKSCGFHLRQGYGGHVAIKFCHRAKVVELIVSNL
jgi:hypothetical protein